MIISSWYEDLSAMIILFRTLKIIFIECFYIQNVEVETRWHKNKQIIKTTPIYIFRLFPQFNY